MQNPITHLPIKQKDLDSHEKVEKFISIFGRQKYYQAIQALSKQRFGDGTAESLQNEMIRIDISKPEGEKRYRELRERLADVQSTLKKADSATYELPVYEHTADAIFQHRDTARKYLGPERYLTAAFPGAAEVVNDQTLRASNPAIREEKQKQQERQRMIERKEKELADLKG
jgi:hypothetical protein